MINTLTASPQVKYLPVNRKTLTRSSNWKKWPWITYVQITDKRAEGIELHLKKSSMFLFETNMLHKLYFKNLATISHPRLESSYSISTPLTTDHYFMKSELGHYSNCFLNLWIFFISAFTGFWKPIITKISVISTSEGHWYTNSEGYQFTGFSLPSICEISSWAIQKGSGWILKPHHAFTLPAVVLRKY